MKWTKINKVEQLNDGAMYLYFDYGLNNERARFLVTPKILKYFRKRFPNFKTFIKGQHIFPMRVKITYDVTKYSKPFNTFKIIDIKI